MSECAVEGVSDRHSTARSITAAEPALYRDTQTRTSQFPLWLPCSDPVPPKGDLALERPAECGASTEAGCSSRLLGTRSSPPARGGGARRPQRASLVPFQSQWLHRRSSCHFREVRCCGGLAECPESQGQTRDRSHLRAYNWPPPRSRRSVTPPQPMVDQTTNTLRAESTTHGNIGCRRLPSVLATPQAVRSGTSERKGLDQWVFVVEEVCGPCWLARWYWGPWWSAR